MIARLKLRSQLYAELIVFSGYIMLSIAMMQSGEIPLIEPFNIVAFFVNLSIIVLLMRQRVPFVTGIGLMLIISIHSTLGHRLAPEMTVQMTVFSKSIFLLVNLFAFYTGSKLYEKASYAQFMSFIVSYFLLFCVFMLTLENARYLFLLSVLGLCAVSHDRRLLFYFWAIVLSFSFCQPYAWQTAILFLFLFKIIFSVKSNHNFFTMQVFLISGLIFLFFVLFPMVGLILAEDFRSMLHILSNAQIRQAICLTGITATLSTFVLALFCIPLAYAVTRLEFWGKPLLLSLIDIPIVIPQSAAGIALLSVFGRNQYLGEVFFSAFGLRFDGTVLGICLAQVFVAMPFITKSAITVFSTIPVSLEQNARVLGATTFSAFWRVTVPLSAKGLFTGAVLSWARAAGEFGAVLFIASYPLTAPVAVYNRFVSVGLAEVAPLVSTLLMFSLLMFFLLQFASRWLLEVNKEEF